MRFLSLVALTISISLACVHAQAQTSSTADGVSSVATPAEASEDAAFASFPRVTPGMKPPKATFAPDPKFPDLPADAEPRGTVVLLIGVNTKGRVEPVRVLRSDQLAFEKSAVMTVRKWKFKPAQKDGHPVPVQVTVEMKFQR